VEWSGRIIAQDEPVVCSEVGGDGNLHVFVWSSSFSLFFLANPNLKVELRT
jgi:hypothetical protein